MAKKRGRESNVGLVVTLIFFILLSIGLGVATYYGFAQQDKLTKDAAAAAAAQKDAEAQRNWYRFQALTYRGYLGQTQDMDAPSDPKDPKSVSLDNQLKLDRDDYLANKLGKDSKGEFPDKPSVAKLIASQESKKYHILAEDEKTKAVAPMDVTMTWDNNKQTKDGKPTPRPKYSYEDVYAGLRSLWDSQTGSTVAAVKAKDEAEAAKKKSDDEKAAAQKAYADEVAKLTKQNNDDLAKERADNAALRNQLDQANKEKADVVQAGEDKLKAQQKVFVQKDARIKELEGRVTDLNDRLAMVEKKQEETPSGGKPIPTDYKIVEMDRSGKEPFVNLGTAEAVRPGVTFSIHGRGPDGRPTPASKGTLEVINVINDHLSQAQVVSVKDAQKDPILPGDFLYNPVFKPGGAQHVVIAGRIAMHGTQGDDLEEFERLLQRRNVVVDGYVDPQDGSVKGKLTVGTDYLVLGDAEGAPEAAKTSIKQLQDEARNNGVQIVKARDFLESMGYKTP